VSSVPKPPAQTITIPPAAAPTPPAAEETGGVQIIPISVPANVGVGNQVAAGTTVTVTVAQTTITQTFLSISTVTKTVTA
jgi:hypothetical protein